MSPTPLTIPPRDKKVENRISQIARTFRESRTIVFASLGKPADELLRDPDTARVVEWYNSAYNEAIAIRQKATVFDSFWLPNAVVESSDSPRGANETEPFSYSAFGACPLDVWNVVSGSFRIPVQKWRAGRLSLNKIIEKINREIQFTGAEAASGGVSFRDRLRAYGGELTMQEAAFTVQGGRGLRDVRCILDWHGAQNTPLAAIRLFGAAG